jgi:hypothetical protein
MVSPAELTILVLMVAGGVGLWTMHDRLAQMQRDLEAIKRTLEADPPADHAA